MTDVVFLDRAVVVLYFLVTLGAAALVSRHIASFDDFLWQKNERINKQHKTCFLQYEALAVAGAIVFSIAHPLIFGVQKGEHVLLITHEPVAGALSVRLAVALENGKVHQDIRIAMGEGMEALATVESYSGLITPARVSIKPENAIRVI